jgi:hypothetical protein
MLKVVYRLFVANHWFEDEGFTIERLKKVRPPLTLLKLEFLSSLSLNLSMTTTRYSVYVALDQQEESFGVFTELAVVERFIKFLNEPKSLLR